jgi:hypothetical protein
LRPQQVGDALGDAIAESDAAVLLAIIRTQRQRHDVTQRVQSLPSVRGGDGAAAAWFGVEEKVGCGRGPLGLAIWLTEGECLLHFAASICSAYATAATDAEQSWPASRTDALLWPAPARVDDDVGWQA